MYFYSIFEGFSISDSKKFETRLKKWCKQEYGPKTTMLIFDEEKLLIKGISKAKVANENIYIYEVALSEISFSYLRISESMCIMHKIWENETQSVMYNNPSKWTNAAVWIAG